MERLLSRGKQALFENRLLRNIEESLKGLEPFQVSFRRGRYYVKIEEENLYAAQRRLRQVFGIVSISPVFPAKLDLEEICRQALQLLKNSYKPGMTFKIVTRRANKNFPILPRG